MKREIIKEMSETVKPVSSSTLVACATINLFYFVERGTHTQQRDFLLLSLMYT